MARRSGHNKVNHVAIESAERQRQALELRKAGVGFQQIADKLGYADHSGAYRAVATALKKTLQEPADELRAIEVERLDQLLLGLWPKAIKGDTWSVDRVLKIMERRSALLGLDAPVKRELTANIDHVISRPDLSILSVAELESLLPLAEKVAAGEVER